MDTGTVGPPTLVASDVRSSSPGTPSRDETVSWQTYASTSYGYTLKFPAGWVAPTSPDNQQSFASENSGGPLGLSANGIWFYVLVTHVTSASCPTTNVAGNGAILSQHPSTISGSAGVIYVFNDGDGFFDVISNVWHGRCYDLFFATKSAPTRDSYRHVIDLILAHITFGP